MLRGARFWTGGDEVIYSILDVMYAKRRTLLSGGLRIFTRPFRS